MSLIQSNMSMSEVVEAHTSLIPVINRLGIRLGLKDKSVREVCHEYGLTSQIQYDEQVWFPYCLSTITEEGNRPCLEIAEGKNRKEDDNTEALLADLKSIMIKHLSGDYNENLCYAVLFAITTLEKDIKQHNRIRERILRQMVQKMEKTNQITE